MLSEFDTAVAVARGLGLLSASKLPHEASSGQGPAGYVLRNARGEALCEVPQADLQGWIPSGQLSAPVSIEEVIGAPTGDIWEYCFVRVDMEDQDTGTNLKQVLINGQGISSLKANRELIFSQFHELLNLIGARGWELVNTVPRSIDAQGHGRSYSLVFKRRCHGSQAERASIEHQ